MKGMIWRAVLVLMYWLSALLFSWLIGLYVLTRAGWWALLFIIPLIFLVHGLLAVFYVSLKGW